MLERILPQTYHGGHGNLKAEQDVSTRASSYEYDTIYLRLVERIAEVKVLAGNQAYLLRTLG